MNSREWMQREAEAAKQIRHVDRRLAACLAVLAFLFFVIGVQVGMAVERGRWERGEKVVSK